MSRRDRRWRDQGLAEIVCSGRGGYHDRPRVAGRAESKATRRTPCARARGGGFGVTDAEKAWLGGSAAERGLLRGRCGDGIMVLGEVAVAARQRAGRMGRPPSGLPTAIEGWQPDAAWHRVPTLLGLTTGTHG